MATYNELVARLKGYTEDDGDEFDAQIDWFLRASELRLARDLGRAGSVGVTTVYTATLLAGTTEVPKTDLWMGTIWFAVVDEPTGKLRLLDKRNEAFVKQSSEDSTPGPLYYSDIDEDSFFIWPPPADAIDVEIKVEEPFTTIVGSSSATWISQHYEDLLFYGALLEAAAFHKSPTNYQLYKTVYDSLIENAQQQALRQNRDAQSFVREGR